jgi:hypothetical protein
MGSPPEPQLVEAVRSLLNGLAPEQQPNNATLPDTDPDKAKKDEPKKRRAIWWQLGQLALTALVCTAAFVGVFVFIQLTRELGASRKEMGRLRRELGLVRQEVVRKDEFNNRNLAAQALIREAQASGKAAADASLQRLQEQKQALAELGLLLRELQRDAERLDERLAAWDKAPGGARPDPSSRK